MSNNLRRGLLKGLIQSLRDGIALRVDIIQEAPLYVIVQVNGTARDIEYPRSINHPYASREDIEEMVRQTKPPFDKCDLVRAVAAIRRFWLLSRGVNLKVNTIHGYIRSVDEKGFIFSVPTGSAEWRIEEVLHAE